MHRFVLIIGLVLPLLTAGAAGAQEWSPPSRQMPDMPRVAELRADWLAPRAAWFQDVEQLSGVAPARLRADGEPRSGQGLLHIARFLSGAIPVVIWVDLNADGRADTVEILRSGTVVVQLIDADRDGRANVLRIYDAAGTLLREERM